MIKKHYVYKITCLCDEYKDKFYIGSHYGYTDDMYTGSGKLIKEYFKLYGKDGTYKKEILEISESAEYIKSRELEIIKLLINDDMCLNMRVWVAKYNGDKISKAIKGKPKSDTTKMSLAKQGKNNPMYGKHHTKEVCERMSKSRMGRIAYNKGQHHTEEVKRKISEAGKRAWLKRKAA